MKLIEEALPVQDLYIEVSNKDKQMRLPLQEEPHEKVSETITDLFKLLISNGKTKNETIKILRNEAIFKNHLAILEATIEEIKNG